MSDTSSAAIERIRLTRLVWVQFVVIIAMGVAIWCLYRRQQAMTRSLEVDHLKVNVITLLDRAGNRVGGINGGFSANSGNNGSAPRIQLLSPDPAVTDGGLSRQIRIGFVDGGPQIQMKQAAKQGGAGINALTTTLGAISTQVGVHGLSVFSSDGQSSTPWQGIQLYFSDSTGAFPNEYYCRLPETYEVVKKRLSSKSMEATPNGVPDE